MRNGESISHLSEQKEGIAIDVPAKIKTLEALQKLTNPQLAKLLQIIKNPLLPTPLASVLSLHDVEGEIKKRGLTSEIYGRILYLIRG